MSKLILKGIGFALLLSSSLAFGQMGLFQSAPPSQNPSAPTPADDQKTMQMMEQQTNDQVNKQIQQYNADHPIPTEGLTTPSSTPQPPPPAAPSSGPAAQSTTTTTTTTGQNPVPPQAGQAPNVSQPPNTKMPTPATSPPLPPATDQYSVLPEQAPPQQKKQGYTGFQGQDGTGNSSNTNAPKPAPGWNIKY